MKEDNEMAARRTITVVESVAEILLTLAYMLCIVEDKASVCVLGSVLEQLGHVAVTFAYRFQNRKFYPAPPVSHSMMSVGALHSCHRRDTGTSLDLPVITHGHGLYLAQEHSPLRLLGSLFLLH
jgi:hypothetical protein